MEEFGGEPLVRRGTQRPDRAELGHHWRWASLLRRYMPLILNKTVGRQLEKSNECEETEKNGLDFSRAFNFWISKKKKQMALKLFEFVEQFTIDTFLLKLNPIWEKWINT